MPEGTRKGLNILQGYGVSPAGMEEPPGWQGLEHLSGPSAEVRQVLAAHFLRGCPHVIEIGGHLRPVTPYLTHQPQSVLSIDPKIVPYEAEELNGFPCHVRHVDSKFQHVNYNYAPRSYGLVMLGLSLKPYGSRSATGEKLFSLARNARIVVVDFAVELDRAATQSAELLALPGLSIHCSLELRLDDAMIGGSPYAARRFVVLRPAA